MDSPAIYAALGEVFSDVFRRPVELRPGLTARDVSGWDSFKQIEIIMAAEERFGVTFTVRDMDGLKCVGDLVAAIERKA